ncbi:MAG: KH domain-containing protein [Deltaproteobacteria bacterium]
MGEVETAKVLFGLIKRMGVEPEIRGSLKEGYLCLEVEGDREGILIGKHGRILEALEVLINRMVNKRVKESVGLCWTSIVIESDGRSRLENWPIVWVKERKEKERR